MTATKTEITPELYNYLVSRGVKLHPVQQELNEYTKTLDNSVMLTSIDQNQFFQFLIKILNAKKTIDVGVYTGMSSLSVALALPEDGKVYALDVSYENTANARSYWKKAGVDNKIELLIAPANESLQKFVDDGQSNTFDFIFIDADKVSYDIYYEYALKLIRKGGIIAFDNVLQHGKILDQSLYAENPNIEAIAKLNDKIYKDDRVFISMLPVADGILFVTKN